MEIRILKPAHRFIQRADKGLKEKIKNEIIKVAQNPYIGSPLSGSKLKKIFRYKFYYKGIHYRIAYAIEENILVILISSRENFYAKLKTKA